MRLIYLSGIKQNDQIIKNDLSKVSGQENNQVVSDKQITEKKIINQIKNITQEEKSKPKFESEMNKIQEISIKSFNQLVEICNLNKELKLKYELLVKLRVK